MRRLMISGLALSVLLAMATLAAAQNRDLIAALSSANATERATAACELSRLDADEVRPAQSALLALLGDDTPVEGELCRDWGNWGGRDRPSSPGREAAMALEELGTEVLPEVDLLDVASFTLVKGWCTDICDEECNGECAGATAIGCDCYWICENGGDGESHCGGSIGVKICTLPDTP